MAKRNRHRGVKVLRLRDGRNVARFTDPISGKQRQQSLDVLGLTTAKQRELWAIAKLAELQLLREQIALGAVQVRVTVEQAQCEYLDGYGNANTRVAKLPALASFAEWVAGKGVVDVQDVAAPVIAAWCDHVHRPANPHKVGTRNLHVSVIAAWLRWCRRRGMLPRVTGDQIRDGLRRKKAARDPIEVLAPAELRALLRSLLASDAAGERPQIAPFALLVLLTGMRFGEARGLTWPEVDFDGKVLRLGSGRVKTQAARVVTLAETPAALELLRVLRLQRGNSLGRVFVDIHRDRIEVNRKRTVRRYDAPRWTWHMLRRTCGSLVCSAGVLGTASVFLVAKRLGHSVQVAERHYLGTFHNLPRDVQTIEAAAGIEDLAREIVRTVSDVQPGAAAAS